MDCSDWSALWAHPWNEPVVAMAFLLGVALVGIIWVAHGCRTEEADE